MVLSTKSDKGLADVDGWVLPKSINVKGTSLNVMVADTVSFEKEGTPVSVGEILSNPDEYRFDLVKVKATRKQTSILYDPDDNSGIEFPVTSGYLVENPETVKTFLRKAIERGKKIVRENGKPSIVKDILQPEKERLPVFDFETDYWVNSPAVTNGIVLPSGSQVIDVLKKLVPALNRNLQLDTSLPVLYDVKTNLEYESVPSISQVKENPEQFRSKVIGFTAKGFGGGISIRESLEELPPCGPEKIQIPTPEGPVCVNILVDTRVEGLIGWNDLSVPPERKELLLTVGVSSMHQDEPHRRIEDRFKFVGRVLSTKQIHRSLPEGLALVIYDRRKIGSINYEQLAESVKKEIENKISTANWSLTGFSENRIPQVPSQPPSHLVSPERPVLVRNPNQLPKTVRMAENLNLRVRTAGPEAPIDIDLENSKVAGLHLRFGRTVENVRIYVRKLAGKPPELPEPPKLVHAYMEISSNTPEEAIENAGINFWILKE